MKNKTVLLSAVLAVLIFSCSNPSSGDVIIDLNPVESFLPADAPEAFTFASLDFKGPWGYGKAENASRLYPLLVSGCWGEGASQYSAVAQRYPAFVLDYQKYGEAEGKALGQWIVNAVNAGYRIDLNRVYLTGFSAGGSGSFPLARGMYSENLYFAAIIRVAGQSEPDLGNAIASKTALWYHIGLSDTSQRVDVARAALAKNLAYACNAKAVEYGYSDTFTGYPRTTVKLSRYGYPVFLYSEYTGMGHTPSPCYDDAALFPWLFSHSLNYR